LDIVSNELTAFVYPHEVGGSNGLGSGAEFIYVFQRVALKVRRHLGPHKTHCAQAKQSLAQIPP
jgi:hypothetical protein